MVKVKIEKVGINEIFENPTNPRSINKQKFNKLINTIPKIALRHGVLHNFHTPIQAGARQPGIRPWGCWSS